MKFAGDRYCIADSGFAVTIPTSIILQKKGALIPFLIFLFRTGVLLQLLLPGSGSTWCKDGGRPTDTERVLFSGHFFGRCCLYAEQWS